MYKYTSLVGPLIITHWFALPTPGVNRAPPVVRNVINYPGVRGGTPGTPGCQKCDKYFESEM